MQKYECSVCGYVYDPEDGDPDNGVDPGTPFEDLPDDWVCPVCGATKDQFEPAQVIMGQDFLLIYNHNIILYVRKNRGLRLKNTVYDHGL